MKRTFSLRPRSSAVAPPRYSEKSFTSTMPLPNTLTASALGRLDHNAVYAAGSHHGCLLAGENLTGIRQNLAGHRVSDCIYQLVPVMRRAMFSFLLYL